MQRRGVLDTRRCSLKDKDSRAELAGGISVAATVEVERLREWWAVVEPGPCGFGVPPRHSD